MRTGLAPVRTLSWVSGALAAFGLAAAPLPLSAAHAQAPALLGSESGPTQFQASRRGELLWFGPARSGEAAAELLALLRSAEADGLDPNKYRVDELSRAVRAAWGGNRRAAQRADALLSRAFVAYVRDLRRSGDIGIIYVDAALRPAPPSARAILEAAARAPSLRDHVAGMGWMHPIYAELRAALVNRTYASEAQRRQLLLNLERARELPAPRGRHILVNTAAQRLFLYEDGEVVDSMRVVVGKPKNPTPMMAALIRFTSLNPYWYVPPDLAAERIAPNVLKDGLGYLRRHGYQVMSSWAEEPRIVDPETVDWQGVADGRVEVYMRQLPGPGNAMGRMKFMFPNAQGIYLHDTPDKQLLTEASRLFSGGCVRLEDAPRLGAWLHGGPLDPKGAESEEKVPLARPVPVHITYLTAVPEGSSIAFFDDIYGRDAARMAELRAGSRLAASR